MPSANSLPGTVSLVVAITGHRDLHPDDLPDLEAEVGRILKNLQDTYPSTPLLLLSGLAEGADRLAVRAAKAASIPWLAVLPMPEELYKTDFATSAGLVEFEEQWTGASRRLILPLVGKALPGEVAHQGPARDLQYERLGEFLVNYSQIMIAIWDKKRLGKQGGTSDVVAMKLGEKRGVGTTITPRMNGNGAGPVHEIFSRRVSTGKETPPGVKYTIAYPAGTSRKDYDASYKLLNQYNSDVEEHRARLSASVEKSRRGLFEGADPAGLTPAMDWLADVYSWADVLAIHFQTRSLRLWKAVFLLLAIGGVALTWLHTLDGGWEALFGYWACLGFAFLMGRREVKGKRRDRHEDYRALAEALRVQFFWMVAGIPDLAAEKYLRKQTGEMAWIRDAMSECGLYEGVLERSQADRGGAASRLSLAQKWVEGQANYFRKTSLRHQARKNRFNLFAMTAAVVGILAPLAGLLTPLYNGRPEPEIDRWSHAVSGIAMWCAALSWNYSERRGFVQEARQYARMFDLFDRADESLKRDQLEASENSFKDAEATIRELGHEALAENGDWLAMHRERKLTPGLGLG